MIEIKKIVVYGPSGSGKTTELVLRMKQGVKVFDSDFIYTMYKIHVSKDNESAAWSLVVEKFKQLYAILGSSFDEYVVYTADIRIRDFLVSKGWFSRTKSKVFAKGDPKNRPVLQVDSKDNILST